MYYTYFFYKMKKLWKKLQIFYIVFESNIKSLAAQNPEIISISGHVFERYHNQDKMKKKI